MDDVTMNHIFLKDWADYAALNKVPREYFPATSRPGSPSPAAWCAPTSAPKSPRRSHRQKR
jgi:aminoacrylate peracid reductase